MSLFVVVCCCAVACSLCVAVCNCCVVRRLRAVVCCVVVCCNVLLAGCNVLRFAVCCWWCRWCMMFEVCCYWLLSVVVVYGSLCVAVLRLVVAGFVVV